MDLLERIKDLCKEKGISHRRLEQELGLGNGAISKWVKSSPSSDIMEKLADYFNVSVDYLLGRIDFRAWDEKYNKNGQIAAEVQEIESLNPYRGLTKDEIRQMETFKNYLISQRTK